MRWYKPPNLKKPKNAIIVLVLFASSPSFSKAEHFLSSMVVIAVIAKVYFDAFHPSRCSAGKVKRERRLREFW